MLAGVLITYSYSFQDVTLLLARQKVEQLQEELDQNQQNKEQKKVPLWDRVKTYAPLTLTVVPVTLTLFLLYGLSRIITQVTLLKAVTKGDTTRQLVQIERTTPVTGIKFTKLMDVNQLNKVNGSKIYTGTGPNGISDKKTSYFYLRDRLAKYWLDRYYIVMRNGTVLNNDGKSLDAFFEPVSPDSKSSDAINIHSKIIKEAPAFIQHKSNRLVKDIISRSKSK